MTLIEIDREPVELFKVLKFEGLTASGGEAKHFISEGLVQVNGVVETRKRKKLQAGDRLIFAGQEFELVKVSHC